MTDYNQMPLKVSWSAETWTGALERGLARDRLLALTTPVAPPVVIKKADVLKMKRYLRPVPARALPKRIRRKLGREVRRGRLARHRLMTRALYEALMNLTPR